MIPRKVFILKILSPILVAFGFDVKKLVEPMYRGSIPQDIGFVHAPYIPLNIEAVRKAFPKKMANELCNVQPINLPPEVSAGLFGESGISNGKKHT